MIMTYYVTFWIQSCINGSGKFAIKCSTMEQAQEIAYDIYSLQGVKYLKINKSGRIRKDYMPIDDTDRYLAAINTNNYLHFVKQRG